MIYNLKLILTICILSSSPSYLFSQDKNQELEAAERMVAFVEEISKYASDKKGDTVLIIPQNGVQLAFANLDLENGVFNDRYLGAIHGIGVEDLFFSDSGRIGVDEEKLSGLKMIRDRLDLPIFVSDFVKKPSNYDLFKSKIKEERFIGFLRGRDNYLYEKIPEYGETSPRDNEQLSNVEAYLYHLQYDYEQFQTKDELIEAIDQTDYDMLLLELFWDDDIESQLDSIDIAKLRSKPNGGTRRLLCYMNIGAAEDWRWYWKAWKLEDPKVNWVKDNYEGWKGERWVRFWDKTWKEILMYDKNSYVNRIIKAGFDGIFLDNVEVYKQDIHEH